MSKFNQTNKGINSTTNKSGNPAFKMEDKAKLVTQVLTTFFGEKKFYGDTTSDLMKTAKIVANAEPRFVANLARYARKEMHLRSVSHALTALVSHEIETKPFIKEVVDDVVERADDITEILACYITMYGKPVPNGLKKALANALGKFNEYQISKYNGGNKSVKFRDVLAITHAKPKTEEQNELFNKIMNDSLAIAERWETELSAKGNTKDVWEELINDNKVGYMAMLRNLRNIVNAKPSNINKVFDKLSDKEQIAKSKQLPFRFFSAYKELEKVSNAGSKVFDTLETAIESSVDNIPKLKGTTIVAIDVSGSMSDFISNKSSIRCIDLSRLLGVMASKICEDAIVYTFANRLEKVTVSSKSGILEKANSISFTGGGTNMHLPLQKMIDDKIIADRIIILSDNEVNYGYCGFKHGCQALADKYRKDVNKNLWVHAIDLQGYGTQQFMGAKNNIIAGWNEKIFEFINLAEEGVESQVEAIENYKSV